MVGRLIYLMGASGAGKDSLLDAVRGQLEAQRCRIVTRVITRSAEAKGENAIAVSAEEFDRRRRDGDFAMSWEANGLAYGIPKEIDAWLAAGSHVLVNGSREYLHEARKRYPDLLAVLLQVEPEVLRARLLERGRETPDDIEARLMRNSRFASNAGKAGDGVICLDNSGPLQDSVTRLVQLIGSSAHAFD